MKINTVIADDESHARLRLKQLLDDFDEIKIIGEAENGDELLKLIMNRNPDIVFIDINMPGISVFKTIESLKNPPLIVFQTAYSEFAVKAFEVNAVDYLLKPIVKENLIKTINKIKNALNKSFIKNNKNETDKKNFLSVKTNDGIKILNYEDIIKICFTEGFAFIYIKESRFLSNKPLKYYEELLNESGFIKVNRNSIINIKKIVKIHKTFNSNYELELINNDYIKISRRKISILKEHLSF